MDQAYCFKEKLQLGKSIEDRVAGYLRLMEGTVRVDDVSCNPEYQRKGIDLLWSRRQKTLEGMVENEESIEVKADEKMAKTGNFFLETKSNEERGTLGWFIYSEANILAYVSVPEDIMYVMKLQPVREWVLERKSEFYEARTATMGEFGGVLYHTCGLLVPSERLMGAIPKYVKKGKFSK